jgi:hypothetical protein
MTEEPADLSSFGGGIDHDDANPEDKDNRYLSEWLTRGDRRVYWDRKKTYGHGTFDITTRQRPDLVIVADGGNYAVEVKRAERSSNVYDGAEQVIKYWRDIEEGRAEYSLSGEKIDIEAVILATRHSPNGHLFHGRQNKDEKRSGRGRRSSRAVENSYIPEVEHASSETLLRAMHRFARLLREWHEDITGQTGIGGLYSSALDGDDGGRFSVPAAFHIAPGRGERATNWDYIPFHKKEGH